MKKNLFNLLLLSLVPLMNVQAQDKGPINYDEDKVPNYALPELLVTNAGHPVTTVKEWEKIRRPEILKTFSDEEFGYFPKGKVKMTSKIVEESHQALNGTAIRRQIQITFSGNGKTRQANLLLYLPKHVEKAPVFLCLNFKGNHCVASENEFSVPAANNNPRGMSLHRWPLRKIISAGYGVATAWYFDFYKDTTDGVSESVLPLFGSYDLTKLKGTDGQAISAWAWGMSRLLDCLEKQKEVDKKKVIAMGHSRLGKTALWAGAQDKRFAIIISNESGCGGAALSKRAVGETVFAINTTFPHWFCKNFHKYNNNEQALPFDQHELIALAAPRPIYVTSAEEDRWADPLGQYLACYHATPIYQLYGYEGMTSKQQPAIEQPVHKRIGYHIRKGEHNVKDYDWDNYIQFADQWLGK